MCQNCSNKHKKSTFKSIYISYILPILITEHVRSNNFLFKYKVYIYEEVAKLEKLTFTNSEKKNKEIIDQ